MATLSIPVVSASLNVDQGPRFTKSLSFEAENPKRFPIYRNTTTDSDGTRVITITYSDKSTETRTEKPIKASVSTNATGKINILV